MSAPESKKILSPAEVERDYYMFTISKNALLLSRALQDKLDHEDPVEGPLLDLADEVSVSARFLLDVHARCLSQAGQDEESAPDELVDALQFALDEAGIREILGSNRWDYWSAVNRVVESVLGEGHYVACCHDSGQFSLYRGEQKQGVLIQQYGVATTSGCLEWQVFRDEAGRW